MTIIKKATLTISRTIQMEQFEPLKVEASIEAEVDMYETPANVFGQLRESLINEVNLTIDNFLMSEVEKIDEEKYHE